MPYTEKQKRELSTARTKVVDLVREFLQHSTMTKAQLATYAIDDFAKLVQNMERTADDDDIDISGQGCADLST